MFVKLSFYYRAHDSAQNGVHSKKIIMSLWPVRSDGSFIFLCESMLYDKVMHLFTEQVDFKISSTLIQASKGELMLKELLE